MADKSDISDPTSPVAKSSRCFIARPDDIEYVTEVLAAQEKGNTYKPLTVANLYTIALLSRQPLPTATLDEIIVQGAVHPPLRIRVYFFDSEEYTIRCDKVMAVVEDWAEYAHVLFVRTTDPENALIRVRFRNGGVSETTVGLQNYVTTDPKDYTMAFGEVTDQAATSPHEKYLILHEFGHVLGLFHEHQTPSGLGVWTPDEEKVKDFYYGWDPYQIQLQVTRRHPPQEAISFSVIDLDSVMTYPLREEMSVQRIAMRENYKLSKWDKAFMVINYPRIGNPARDLKTDGSVDITWTIEAALDILGVVAGDDPVGEPAGFTPLVAEYQEEGAKAQELPAAEEADATACARVRILYLYGKLGETVAALAGDAESTKTYVKSSTRITTSIRNIFGKWTHRNFFRAQNQPNLRAPVHSNQLQLREAPAAEAEVVADEEEGAADEEAGVEAEIPSNA